MLSHFEQFSQRFKVCLPPAVPPLPLHIADVKEDSLGRIHVAGHYRFEYLDLGDGDVLPLGSCYIIRDLPIGDNGEPNWLDVPVKCFTPLSNVSSGGTGMVSEFIAMNLRGDVVFSVTALDFDVLKEHGTLAPLSERYFVSYAGHDGYYEVPEQFIPHGITPNCSLLVHRKKDDGSYESGIFSPASGGLEDVYTAGEWGSGLHADILAVGRGGAQIVGRTVRGGELDGENLFALKAPTLEAPVLLNECSGILDYGGRGITLGIRPGPSESPLMNGDPVSVYWNSRGEFGSMSGDVDSHDSRFMVNSLVRLASTDGSEGAFCFVGRDLATAEAGSMVIPGAGMVYADRGGGAGVIWYGTDSQLRSAAPLEPVELQTLCVDTECRIEGARGVSPSQIIVADVANENGSCLSSLLMPERFWK